MWPHSGLQYPKRLTNQKPRAATLFAHPHHRLSSDRAEQVCTRAPGHEGLGGAVGEQGLHTHMCQCRAPMPGTLGRRRPLGLPGWFPTPPPPASPAPSPQHTAFLFLILLNTKSHPYVNWFYSSLLYLPLNEEMPPIKI